MAGKAVYQKLASQFGAVAAKSYLYGDNSAGIKKDENGKLQYSAKSYTSNVDMVTKRGLVPVTKMPAAVRKELMAAVKSGEIGRLKKDGLRPEIFYAKGRQEAAVKWQNEIALKSIEAIAKVMA